jgi:methyl-accepting chemotaxis protein
VEWGISLKQSKRISKVKRARRVKKIKNKVSLTRYIWGAFMGLTVAVILLMWLFQVVFLQKFYITMKTNDVKEATIKISQSYGTDGYEDTLNEIAKDYSVAIRIVSRYGLRDIYSNNDYMSGASIIHGYADISTYVKSIQVNDGYFCQQIFSPSSNTETFLIGTAIYDKIGDIDCYLLVNSSLAPVGSTVYILQKQLIIISIILLVISCILSYIISRRIAQPIDRITKSAKRLANGEYDIE